MVDNNPRKKERLDKLLLARGLARSRERAKAMVMAGKVLVDGRPATKAGAAVPEGAEITLRGTDILYVSRGGLKLQAALEHFQIDLGGLVTMDVGASTGGFTDCMLRAGAARVYAVDVGYGQFDYGLRHDSRVVLIERTNIRHLDAEAVPERIDFAAVDVSFISLRTVLPVVLPFLSETASVVALVKPQFEVGRTEVGKGGIVRQEALRLRAVRDVREAVLPLGLRDAGVLKSPIEGQKGNVEYLLYLRRD